MKIDKTMTEQERIVEKIRNLLNLSDTKRNDSENEAIAAALMAQKLMAKYGIDIAEVRDAETRKDEEIIKEAISFAKNTGYNIKWRFSLANVIAPNFRVKTYTIGKDKVVFYGFKFDVQIAVSVFNYLFATGNKLSVKYYYQLQKEGRSTRGAINEWLMGFVTGLKDVLEKQCTALVLVTPQKVEDSYKEYSKNFDTFKSSVTARSYDRRAFEDGRTEGRFAANSRSIEGNQASA